MDVTRESISRILELREILLSIQIGFSLVNAAVACAILQSNSGLEPSSVITEPRYLTLVTVSSFKVLQTDVIRCPPLAFDPILPAFQSLDFSSVLHYVKQKIHKRLFFSFSVHVSVDVNDCIKQ